jgi:hypothetical protein
VAKDNPQTSDEWHAIYSRLDELIAETKAIQARVNEAVADNRRRDQQRVSPKSRTTQRARHER